MDIEKILKEIHDKEQELGINNSYRGWNNEMYEWIISKGYGTNEIYSIIIENNLIKKEGIVANGYDSVMGAMYSLGDNKIAYIQSSNTFVYRGSNKEYCNEQYCIDNNIPIVDLGQEGGTIVVSPGALGIGMRNIPQIEWNYIKNKIKNYLGAEIDGNDIMINGYKVGPISSSGEYNVLHLSFNIDLELIKKICNKEMNKIPGGITELTGITSEQTLNWLKERLINQ